MRPKKNPSTQQRKKINRIKRQMKWEEIFASHVYEGCLVTSVMSDSVQPHGL